jgi:hypothetical protein
MKINIMHSPLTNNIYAMNGRNEKINITEAVLSAVAQYMDGTYKSINFPAGELIWNPKEEK